MDTLNNIQELITILNNEIKEKEKVISNMKHNNITELTDNFTENYKKDYFDIILDVDLNNIKESKYVNEIDKVGHNSGIHNYREMSIKEMHVLRNIKKLSFLKDEIKKNDE